VIEILKNIVEALLQIEKDGYHFCDLKPENILITQENSAKLGDLESLIKL
jgi:serine/threonine protein kinase